MKHLQTTTLDANEAVARVAHKINEVIAIYPITPASPMGEWADAWSMAGKKNIWGTVWKYRVREAPQEPFMVRFKQVH